MSARKPFLFDEDFGETRPAERPEDRAEVAAAIRAAADRAFEEGRAQGARETDLRLVAGIESLSRQLGDIVRASDGERQRLTQACTRMVPALVRAYAGQVLARTPLGPLMDAAADCFRHLAGEPHVVVRVAADLVDAAKQQLDRAARDQGMQGRLIVLGEPGRGPGDFAIEWADGGIERDGAAVDRAVAEAVARHLAALN